MVKFILPEYLVANDRGHNYSADINDLWVNVFKSKPADISSYLNLRQVPALPAAINVGLRSAWKL